jgi:hypothetical protein
MRREGQWMYISRTSEVRRSAAKLACMMGRHRFTMSTGTVSRDFNYCVRCGKRSKIRRADELPQLELNDN